MKRWILLVLVTVGLTGCQKPYMVPKFVTIEPNEYAFVIPYGKTTDQVSTGDEEYWKQKQVNAKEIEIPQIWVQEGRGWSDGRYKDDVLVIKVDGSPVTREWTSDPTTGTSTKNEAIWTMTADQIKWTVGWTITARIASLADASKFLANYPSGTLAKVLDTEVRGKLTTAFNLAVTDLPMKQLQEHGVPVFAAVNKEVVEFFKSRGITITNLGPNGPYVYDNPNITKVMEEKFTAAQQSEINQSKTAAKAEENKAIQLAAEAKAKATLTEQQAIADGIKLVADAKAYEIEKANKDLATYLKLKTLENDKAAIEKWTGTFPTTMLSGSVPFSLLRTEDKPAK